MVIGNKVALGSEQRTECVQGVRTAGEETGSYLGFIERASRAAGEGRGEVSAAGRSGATHTLSPLLPLPPHLQR